MHRNEASLQPDLERTAAAVICPAAFRVLLTVDGWTGMLLLQLRAWGAAGSSSPAAAPPEIPE